MKREKRDTKHTLVEAGVKLMLAKGYHHTGLQEVVKTAGVPKGSFYHFFSSKEAFAMDVVDAFFKEFDDFMKLHLKTPDHSPLQRLKSFFRSSVARLQEAGCEGGCLVGNLAQEMADQDEDFRHKLHGLMNRSEGQIKDCLEEAVKAGELPAHSDPGQLARFILDSWEGAVLRSKLTKNTDPLDNFMNVVFEKVLC